MTEMKMYHRPAQLIRNQDELSASEGIEMNKEQKDLMAQLTRVLSGGGDAAEELWAKLRALGLDEQAIANAVDYNSIVVNDGVFTRRGVAALKALNEQRRHNAETRRSRTRIFAQR